MRISEMMPDKINRITLRPVMRLTPPSTGHKRESCRHDEFRFSKEERDRM